MATFVTNLYRKRHGSAPTAHQQTYTKPNRNFARPSHILHFTKKTTLTEVTNFLKIYYRL